MHITAVIPIKGFSTAKARLAAGFDPLDRALIATAAAGRVVAACVTAGFETIAVTDDDAVAALATELGATPVADPGHGLDAAVAIGIGAAVGPWMVLHADLPLLGAPTLLDAAELLDHHRWLLAPARDGGTNLLAGHEPIATSYGPGSFHRHLGRLARSGESTLVLVREALAVEIDTPSDLIAASRRPGGRWLVPFLS